MVKIYGAYTELDCVFDDANACALAALAAAGRPRRAAVRHRRRSTGTEYLQGVHLPQVRRLAGGS